MTREHFENAVADHPDLAIRGGRDGAVVVYNSRLDVAFSVPEEKIARHGWRDLSRVLCGGPERAIAHMTRVVGYFSKTHNWNESKLGELADRHAGRYAVGE